MAVIAIVRHDVILRAQRVHRAHGDGFLADVQMQEAADLALLIGRARFFFKAPDQHHLPIPLLQGVDRAQTPRTCASPLGEVFPAFLVAAVDMGLTPLQR